MSAESTNNQSGIAIVGMSCRFPKARTPEQFWENLQNGVECVTEFTKEDLKESGVDPAILNHPAYVNKGIVLEDVEMFDASFFNFSPRDAEIIDPQHRLFLECASEALENAGYDPETYKGLIGVYGGVDISLYVFNIYSNPEVMQTVGMYTITLHNDKDSLTTRVSYKLNLKGPAVTVQTTCSTSLTAIIHACQSLLNYQCDMALAGGVAINLPQKRGYFYQEGGISSVDGHCRAFDEQARGTTGGSGCGIVVLKRLEDAIRDGDHIEAVILGFGMNNDGSDKVGFTAPSITGQAEAIAAAQAMADIEPDTISYIEAHGTGTSMGDPIEISALTQAFRRSSTRKEYCGIGSVKTNIGHCNSAAGVAGVIKTVMSLKNKMMAPSLHFKKPNPNIDFANSPFYVVNKLKPWEANGTLRRAGVSSFGIGGTNTHVILEEAPPPIPTSPSRSWQLLLLSAKTASALEMQSKNIVNFLKEENNYNLADATYTLAVGRKRFAHRRMLLLPNQEHEALKELLKGNTDDLFSTGTMSEDKKSVVFLFTGQGSQYVKMGFGLYQHEPLFKELVDECCEKLIGPLGLDLRPAIYSNDASAPEQLKQTALAQPALFVLEYALARLWMSWGIKPEAMAGHSVGELVAACVSGVFSLDDALQLVVYRGKLMQSMPVGAMVTVHQPKNDTLPLLNDTLSIAAVNTPSSCVVSGPFASIEALETDLQRRGVAYQRLNTSHAFHSGMMDPIIDPFISRVEKVKLHPPQIPFLSNLTGKWMTAELATDPAYWGRQIRNAVLFSENVLELLKHPDRVYLEVGPGNSLCTLLYQHRSKKEGIIAVPSLPHPKDPQPAEKVVLHSLGQLWLAGVEIDWSGYYQQERRRRMILPTYPFERERYWVDSNWKATQSGLEERKKDLSQWLYAPWWKLSALPSDTYEDNLNSSSQTLLIFSNEGEVDAAMIAKWRQQGRKVFCVLQHNEFARLDENTFGIQPGQRDQYSRLLQQVQTGENKLDTIIHFWNFTRHENKPSQLDHINSFNSLLFLAQAYLECNMTQQLQLKIVTNQLFQLHELEKVEANKALLNGACKVIAQEIPTIKCQVIDISVDLFTTNATKVLASQLLNEFAFTSPDSVVMYRNGKRWVLSYKPADISSFIASKTKIRNGGVYLITGGMGGIGLALAKYMGKKYKARLVLTGRSAFPPEDQWEDWLATHSSEDHTSEKIRLFRQLQQLGAEVLPVKADVTDIDQLMELSVQIRKHFGKLNGIIHSAGVAGGGIIAVKKEEQALKVMDPKVKGSMNLQTVFGNQNLDFFVLCSSLAAVVGGVGQIDYCAANSFEDAFAYQHNQPFGTRYISINWDTWGEAGMAVNTEVPDEMKAAQQENLKKGIRNEEGVELFERILSSRLSQVLVSTAELLPRIERFAKQHVLQKIDQNRKPDKAAATHARPKMNTSYVAASTPIETQLTEIWTELLGIDQIGVDDNFLELGGHSLLAIQLTSRMRTAFNMEFSMQTFFEAPTIRAVAAYIDKRNQNKGMEFEKPSLTKLSREKYRLQSTAEEKQTDL